MKVILTSRSCRASLAVMALAVLAFFPRASAQASESPTDGALARAMLGHLLEPVLEVLADHPGAERIAIRKPAGMPAAALLHEEVGNFLYDQGYEVFVLDATMEVPEGALLLDFEQKSAGIDYPREKGGFLGLGRSRTLRRGALGVSGRLEDPADGRWLWRGSPQVQHEDWIWKAQTKQLAADRPTWIKGAPLAALKSEKNWWERGLVAGLLTGVVVLYLDGAR